MRLYVATNLYRSLIYKNVIQICIVIIKICINSNDISNLPQIDRSHADALFAYLLAAAAELSGNTQYGILPNFLEIDITAGAYSL